MKRYYYHMFSNGDDSKNFIICEADFRYAFNLIAVCSYSTKAAVLAFSIEDTHPHLILYGTEEECYAFKLMFERSVLRHILSTRKESDGVSLVCSLSRVEDKDYLMNVAAYVINQATKDGKKVMPYDYYWGTGSLYFRQDRERSLWCWKDGVQLTPKRIGDLTYREKRQCKSSRLDVPDNWLTCNGLILPENYVDVAGFESIYGTPNCFRVFLSSSKKKDREVITRMAETRGVSLEDDEARKISARVCNELFGYHTAKFLSTTQRLSLANELRSRYRMNFRQLSSFCRLPEIEIVKYIK